MQMNLAAAAAAEAGQQQHESSSSDGGLEYDADAEVRRSQSCQFASERPVADSKAQHSKPQIAALSRLRRALQRRIPSFTSISRVDTLAKAKDTVPRTSADVRNFHHSQANEEIPSRKLLITSPKKWQRQQYRMKMLKKFQVATIQGG